MNKTRNIFKLICNFFFSPKCVFCEKTLELNAQEEFCDQCLKKLPFVERNSFCEKCGKPIVGYGKKKRCYFCLNVRPLYFDRIVSVFVYKDGIKDSVGRFKGAGLESYSKVYSRFLSESFCREYGDTNPHMICYAPSHTDKYRRQGFDNVELLATDLSKKIGIPVGKNILTKTRKTQKQTTLGYKQRLRNMQNSMTVKKPEAVAGKVILLIDDVCTTRATIIECSRALKKAGAKRVYALTLATANKGK